MSDTGFKVKRFTLVTAMKASLGIIAIIKAIVPSESAEAFEKGVKRYKEFIKEFDDAKDEDEAEKVFDKFCADIDALDPNKHWLVGRVDYWNNKLKVAQFEQDSMQVEKAMAMIAELKLVQKQFY